MTQIQASVSVSDRVDSTIEQKLKAISVASSQASVGIDKLATSNTRLQTSQVKLQQEQVKLSTLNQRLQQQSINTTTAQNKQAISAANLANAQTRANTAMTRAGIVNTQAEIAATRAQIAHVRLNQSLNQTQRSANGASGSMGGLISTYMRLAAVGATVVGVAQLGDEYQRLINRLTLIQSSADGARNRLSSLSNVATNSYSSIGSITQLYTRLDLALRQTGGSSSEAIQMTQTLSKAVSLAGLTVSESSSALLQISQAFNKGKLDGDEFRTVMETMPPLADALAKKLGVTRGELLKLAPQGKITGEVMKQAVLDMTESIDQKFSQLTPTIAMHLQNLTTEAQMYFGAMFKDSGAASAFASVINTIANDLDVATRFAVAFGVAVTVAMARTVVLSFVSSVGAVVTAVRAATGAMATFGAVVTATPVGTLVTAISLVGVAVDSLFDGAISKTLFPNFDQDVSKAKDYVSRLKDIAGQLDLMSYTKLRQEQALLDKSMMSNRDEIKKFETDITKTSEAIAKTEAKIADMTRALTESEKAQRNLMNNGAGYIDYDAVEQKRAIDLTRELTALKAQEAEAMRNLETAKADDIELMKVQLRNYEEQVERIESARSAIEGKSQADIAASEELRTQQKIVEDAKASYADLTNRINSLRSALTALLGASANLAPTLNEGVVKSEDKVKQEVLARLNQDAEWKQRYASASSDDQKRMEVEKRLSKERERFSAEEWKTIVDNQLKADKAVKTRQDADAKARKAESKAQRDGESAAKKKANQLKKAKEEYEQYVGKLDDEAVLLKEGYQNYKNYNELYALRHKLQQKGLTLSEKDLSLLKQKIDANVQLQKVMQYADQFSTNSYAEKQKDLQNQLQGLNAANLSDEDKPKATNDILSGIGLDTTGMQTYWQQLITDADNTYKQIAMLRDQALIGDEQAFTLRAQVWAKTQESMIAPVANTFGTIASLQNSENKKLAKIGQAAAIAQAIMNTYTGATAAYASAAAIPYVGYIMAPIAAAGAVAAGMANVAAIRSQGTGYYSGGFTGAGNPTEFAGWAHKNEYVFDHKSTNDLGVSNLEALRNGSAEIKYRGEQTGNNTGVSVNIENYGMDKSFDVQQIDMNQIKIIVTDTLATQAGNIVKSYMQSSDGQDIISKTAKRSK